MNPNSYTEEFVKKYLAEHGYKLNSEYVKSRKSIKLVCPRGHDWSISFSRFLNENARCSKCKKEDQGRLNISKVYQIAEGNDCKILTDIKEYKSKLYLDFICACGDQVKKRLDDFIGSPRCKKCGIKMSDSKFAKIYTEEEVKNYLAQFGYILKSKYTRAKSYISTICPNGHKYNVRFDSFKNDGARCRKCRKVERGYSPDEVESYLSQHNCILLNKNEYINAKKTKIRFICSCGNEDAKTFNSFLKFPMCKKCSQKIGIKKNRQNQPKYTQEFVEEHLSEFGYKLKSEYTIMTKPIFIECPKGHEYETTFKNFYHNKKRCKKCNNLTKYFKHEIPDLIKQHGCELIGEYRGRRYKFKFICTCGEIGETRLQDFLRGARCSKCNAEKIKESRRRNKLKKVKQILREDEIC